MTSQGRPHDSHNNTKRMLIDTFSKEKWCRQKYRRHRIPLKEIFLCNDLRAVADSWAFLQ
jgi:hypothetical protein